LDAPLSLIGLGTNNVLADLVFVRSPIWEAKGWIGIPLAMYILNRLRQSCTINTFGRVADGDDWRILERACQDASTTPPRTFVPVNAPSRELDPRLN